MTTCDSAKKYRVVFFGTPEFALPVLESLFRSEVFELVGVVTQPDRPSGRKLQLTPTAVRSKAKELGLDILAPPSINKPEARDWLAAHKADLGIVVAFGQILSQKVLDIFPLGCFNVHASLLPRWRGAAPIQRAIEAGDSITGVCLQKMVKELDAGDLIGQREIPIPGEMNSLQLHEALAPLGTFILEKELVEFLGGKITSKPQDPLLVTVARKIEKSESLISWHQPATQIANRVRAFAWGPGCYTFFRKQLLKLHQVRVSSENIASQTMTGDSVPGQMGDGHIVAGCIGAGCIGAGCIVSVTKDSILVKCGQGFLDIIAVQPESRSKMLVRDFIKGYDVKVGDCLTEQRI